MMCLLPVGSSLSSLAVTVTAKRTLPSVRIASLGPAFLCNLRWQWDKEIQDPKIQGQPKGFTAVSFPSETDSTSPASCFPPKLWFFSESKRLSCCTSLVWGQTKRCLLAVPQPWCVGVLEQMFPRTAEICSLLLHPRGRSCQPLVTLIIMLWPHSVTKGQISLCSLAETQLGKETRFLKRDCQQGYLWAYHVPAIPLSSLPLGEKAHACTHGTRQLPFINLFVPMRQEKQS